MISRLNDIRFSVKLPAVIVGATFVVALAIGTVSFLTARSQTQEMIQAKAEALLQAKKDELTSYLGSIEQDLRVVATNETVLSALRDFEAAWQEMLGGQTETLQAAYIDNNPHPTGQKEKLDRGVSGGTYDDVHARYHPWFRKLLQERSYYDIFLFDLQGNLVYTVFKELDYATNLQTGKYKDTDLGNAFRAALKSGEADSIHFFDFKPYAPSHGAPASFMSTPIYANGTIVGVLVFQMPIDIINAMMSKDAGLGKTGEVMIVGSDKLMRNDSRFTEENDILKSKIDSSGIDGALSGELSFGKSEVYRGEPLEIAALPFDYRGTQWALATAQGSDEINVPVTVMRNQMLMIGVGLLLAVGLAGFYISRTLSQPISGLVGQMQRLAKGDTSIELTGEERLDEIGDMARTVATFKQNAIDRDRLETETEAEQRKRVERQNRIDALLTEFRERVQSSLAAVSSNADQMKASAESLTGIAVSTTERATSANEASGRSASNVQSVAAATEEMTASVSEIGQQVSKANELISVASGEAQSTDEKVASLASAAEKIGNVVSLIQEIAEQTNLLALNATIEAARAGEAGKGFAVVATEVKELASQTGKATEDIANQISGIQTETSDAVSAIQSIAKKMVEVNEFITAIAAAIDEQNASTAEISRNVQEAAQGTQMVVENISEVSTSAEQTSSSSEQLLSASQNVAGEAERMRGVVDKFLEDVAAA